MAKNQILISWRVEEYIEREKSPDWFWALGVIAVAGAAIAIISHDILFAIFIVLGAIVLGVYAQKKPDILDISVNDQGIKIRSFLYPYSQIKGFAVDIHDLGNFLLIETNRMLMPIISIPLPVDFDIELLEKILKSKVEEKPLKEPVSHRLMEHLGF